MKLDEALKATNLAARELGRVYVGVDDEQCIAWAAKLCAELSGLRLRLEMLSSPNEGTAVDTQVNAK